MIARLSELFLPINVCKFREGNLTSLAMLVEAFAAWKGISFMVSL